MSYGTLPTDADSKKFVAVCVDNSGTNVLAAIKGANLATQNAESVAEMAVSAAQLPATLGPKTSTLSTAVTAVANTAILATAVTVNNTAVALPASALANRRSILVQNLGTLPIYVGPSGVLTTAGIKIDAGASLALDLGPSAVLYGKCASAADQDVRVLEVS